MEVVVFGPPNRVTFSTFPKILYCFLDRRPLFARPKAALGLRRGPNRAATAAPIERSKGKKSYDIMSQTRKEGMPSCSLPKGGESRQSRMERSKAEENLKFLIAS